MKRLELQSFGVQELDAKEMREIELQSFGVQELDAKEMREIDGGIIPALIGAAVAACGAAWFVGEKVGRTLYHQLHND